MNYKSLKISILVSLFMGFSVVGVSYGSEIKNLTLDFVGFNSLALADSKVFIKEDVKVSNSQNNGLKKAIVSFTFDDGYKSAYHYAPGILEKFGFKATYYIISNYIGGHGYMNARQILDLDRRGSEIGAHTRNHPNLITLNNVDAVSEIVGSRNDLELLGFHIKSLAYPYGEYNTNVEKIAKEAGYTSARTINHWFNESSTDKFALGGFSINSNTSLDKVFGYIDNAVADKKWAILVFHRINESGNPISVTTEEFEKITDYVSRLDVDVLTVRDAVERLSD